MVRPRTASLAIVEPLQEVLHLDRDPTGVFVASVSPGT